VAVRRKKKLGPKSSRSASGFNVSEMPTERLCVGRAFIARNDSAMSICRHHAFRNNLLACIGSIDLQHKRGIEARREFTVRRGFRDEAPVVHINLLVYSSVIGETPPSDFQIPTRQDQASRVFPRIAREEFPGIDPRAHLQRSRPRI